MGPDTHAWYPHKRQMWTLRCREENATERQTHMQREVGEMGLGHQELGEARKDPLLESLEKAQPCQHLDIEPRSGTAGNSRFNFSKNCQTVSKAAAPFLNSHRQC